MSQPCIICGDIARAGSAVCSKVCEKDFVKEHEEDIEEKDLLD